MKPNISYGFGALTPTTWREIYTTVQAVSSGTSGARVDQSVTREFIFALITNSTPNAVDGTRWAYGWSQVLRTTDQPLWTPTGLTSGTPGYGPAYNTLEASNTNAQVYGGIAITTGRELVASPGFYFDPVPNNVVVLLRLSRNRQNALSADFSAPNPITGACPTGLTTYYDGGTY
jgi:hypothetical protein